MSHQQNFIKGQFYLYDIEFLNFGIDLKFVVQINKNLNISKVDYRKKALQILVSNLIFH